MQIVAHRGASALEPENTLVAFERAMADGARALEFDVRLTADEALIVMHDDETTRTCSVEGRISASTLEQVRSLNAAAAHWPGRIESVPTLEQVVERFGAHLRLFVEVKGAWTGEAYLPAARVLDVASPILASVPDVVLSSFDVEAVAHAATVAPERRRGLASLTGVELGWTLETAIQIGAHECHVPQAQIDAAFIEIAHAAGIAVLGWTVNDLARARELLAMGCDGIFTDDPGAMIAALAT